MPKRYIPCRYTYLKNSLCPKVKKNTDKATVQNNYNVGSRAELLSNMFKKAQLNSNAKIQTFSVNQNTGLKHGGGILPFNSKNTLFTIK
tara:strand:+ start:3144 stop:3410 length:267 start_codon:yes stop_codon:yes gene_type:complete